MKNSSREAAGAAAGTAMLIGLGAVAIGGLSLALRQKARSAKAAAETLALHQARQKRLALRAQRLEHDLRSPIGAMAVALELLRTAGDSATQLEAVQVLERQVARMTSLTEQVHEFVQGLND
jgi:signal transduction histidine kinase